MAVPVLASPTGHAALVVGTILAEALVLYVGYGAAVRVAGPAVREAVRGE